VKILQLHCDYIQFKPKTKALKTAPELTEEEKKGLRLENVLVLFTSFEANDDASVLEEAKRQVEKDYRDVKAENLLVYPYAHLSANLAPPQKAVELLNAFLRKAREINANAKKAPFGYYKEFELKCKGHPLAELSKTIDAAKIERKASALGAKEVVVEAAVSQKPLVETTVSESLKKEAVIKSRFYILTPDGKLIDAEKFDYENHGLLKKFADYEIRKVRVYAQEPPHIKLMKEHKIADYEPASDAGNFRWLPKGRLVKKLLERYISETCVNYGAAEVETPLMYDYEHPALKKYLNRFPARQYVVKSDEKEYFLRFAACFGQFLIAHDSTISYKNLPLKIYELTRYSFRREQSGELAGLKRVRALTMPDMHTLCADLNQAREEFERQFNLCFEWLSEFEIPFEAGFRIQTDFFNENKDWYLRLVKKFGKPVLVEMFDERYAYFITKFEFNFVDNLDKASALSTVQIDVENAETYDLAFTDEKSARKRPPILHASISGSLERVVYAILENEARKIKEGKTPGFPLWLSPTQVRLVPVSDKQNDYCEKLLTEFDKRRVRVDFDDRNETLQSKIRDAEREWIPFIAVVGAKEEKNGLLSVRVRSTGKQESMKLEELANAVEKQTAGKPFEKLPLPQRLSKRPVF